MTGFQHITAIADSLGTKDSPVIRLQPNPEIDAIRALRAALKILLRRFGLRAVEVKEEAA